MEGLGLSDINYNHIRRGSRPSSREVRTLCTAGGDGNLIPQVTAEIWGNCQKMHRTWLIKVGEPDVQRHRSINQNLHSRGRTKPQTHKHHTATITPDSHPATPLCPPTEAHRGGSIFETKNDGFHLRGYLVFITAYCNTNTQRTNKWRSILDVGHFSLILHITGRIERLFMVYTGEEENIFRKSGPMRRQEGGRKKTNSKT